MAQSDLQDGTPGWRSWTHLFTFMLFMAFLLGFVFTAPAILASPHPVRNYGQIVGVLAELLGLTMTLAGLYETWHENAPGRSLYPWLARLWARIRRRSPVVRVHAAVHGGFAVGATVHASAAVGKAGIPTLQEQIDQLREQLSEHTERITENTRAITAERAERQDTIGAVRRELAEGDARVESRAVKLTVNGIPLAVSGLGVTIIGVLLQAFAQGLPS